MPTQAFLIKALCRAEECESTSTLALIHERSQAAAESIVERKAEDETIWKIEVPPLESHLTVNSAIHYATEIRDKASDPVIKKNADETLVKLAHLQVAHE